jgi:predicted membrane chloride channel (bestrophin family)
MLVFRNQTAYSRFWGGRMHLNEVTTAIRCLSRQLLVLVPTPSSQPTVSSRKTWVSVKVDQPKD